MNRARSPLLLACSAATLCLAACGGGGATVGGTLSGLDSGLSISLMNNGADKLTLTANGSFTFATSISGPYNVTILAQPIGQSCSVANGNGTVDALGNSVNSVAVTCL
jgi:hypothetical protein